MIEGPGLQTEESRELSSETFLHVGLLSSGLVARLREYLRVRVRVKCK